MIAAQAKYPGLPKWEVPELKPEQHPTALQVVQQSGVSLRDKTILVTGGSAGIGVETVRAYASAGARVFVLARSVDKTRIVLDKISAEFPHHGGLEIIQGDLDSLASVKTAADDFLARSDKLHILVNNAGIYQVPFALTRDGFESQLQTDHIAHHLLFKKLAPLMVKSSTPTFHSRVIVVASCVHLWADVDFNDMNYTHGRQYTATGAYNQAKLANIWFANHVEKLYGKQGVHALSLHPGLIRTESNRAIDRKALIEVGMFNAEGDYQFPILAHSIEQGAATTVFGSIASELEGKGALYLENAAVAKLNVEGELSGYSSSAFDDEKAAQLWDWTEAAIVKFA